MAAEIKPQKPFNSIDVYYYYYNQTGMAWFDGTRLERGHSITSYTYDSGKNYVTKVKDASGTEVSVGYDIIGNNTSYTNGKGKTTSFAYDGWNLLTSITDAKTKVTAYEYDNAGNRTRVVDAKNNASTYNYNEFNLLSDMKNPLNQITRFEYDKNGNQTKLVYPKGDTTSYGYNVLNRLETVKYNGINRWSYSYDPNGNITAANDLSTGLNKAHIYDVNDRLTEEKTGSQNSIRYNYDDNSNVTGLVMTAGAVSVTNGYKYNSLNQIAQLTRNGINLESFIYNEAGNIVTTNRQNYTSTSSLYDDVNRLEAITNYDANGGILNKFKYQYDANGNRTSVNTNSRIINYQYDELDQLTQESLLNGTIISYEYDAVGNRTKKIVNNGSITNTIYNYNNGNELISVDGQAYTYDLNGNITNNGEKTFIYTIDNRLAEVKNAQGQIIATYTYDHEGKRSSMTASGSTIYYHYSGNNVVYETNASNNIVAEYTYDPNGSPATMTRSGVTYYYHVNGHGDVVSLTNSSGLVVASYDYDAYGSIISQSGAMASINCRQSFIKLPDAIVNRRHNPFSF